MTVNRRLQTVVALLTGSAAVQAQIPIRVLPPAVVRSTERIAAMVDVMHTTSGRVVVNVPEQRRVLSFDSTLNVMTTIVDTGGGKALKYPFAYLPLIRFSADSVLFPDRDSRSLLVVDPMGKVARATAPVKAQDFLVISQRLGGSIATFDRQGRMVYRANHPPLAAAARAGEATSGGNAPRPRPDTVPVVRADFGTRAIDTLSFTKIQPFVFIPPVPGPNGRRTASYTVNPVPAATDDWVVTAEGHVAFVRGSDYHIDWVFADGTRKSTPKMAFDWRRLSDADKQARLDSARHIIDSARAAGTDPYLMTVNDGVRIDSIHPTIEYAALDQIADYFPSIRPGSTLADQDGYIWILPSTSSQAGGGLLYDVVNNKGVVFQRVRAPKDRIIVGFGRGGIVYMAALVGRAEWVLERTRLAPSN